MSHPESCHDPNCQLTYRQHLLTVNIGADALPTRAINRTFQYDADGRIVGKHPDEPVANTNIRDKRWERDHAAYKRLHDEGLRPPTVDGSAFRERFGNTKYDMEHRPVTIDYSDPT